MDVQNKETKRKISQFVSVSDTKKIKVMDVRKADNTNNATNCGLICSRPS